MDYTHKGAKFQLETGVSANIRTMDNPYRDENTSYMPAPIPAVTSTTTSHFKFAEDVYAAYVTYSRSFGKLTASAGLRGEYWKSTVRALPQKADETEKRYLNDSLNFFPAAHLIYDLDERNSLMLSYSSRVARPDTPPAKPQRRFDQPGRGPTSATLTSNRSTTSP